MNRLLAPILLLTLLFPSIAMGETVKWDDLEERDGLYYKKFTEVPFTGKIMGKTQGAYRNGKRHGPWVSYYDNGQLWSKGTFKDGEWEGPRVSFLKDGTLNEKYTGTFKNGVKVK